VNAADGPRDRVAAWVIDPHRVLVTWDVAPATRVRALRRLAARGRNARIAVRLVSDRLETPVDLPLDAETHVLAATPIGPWVAELGFRLADGGFAVVVRSPPTGEPAAPLPASSGVTWVAADRPTVPVYHRWSGRRASFASAEAASLGSSDASLR
jgi:hypothetical protein